MSLILFDQNVPHALASFLIGHTIRVAAELGWGELANGDLLKAAQEANFDLVVTADQNIVYQQNMRERLVGLVVVSTNHWATLREKGGKILFIINQLEPSGYAYVNCGLPPKRRRPYNTPAPTTPPDENARKRGARFAG